MDNKLHIFFLPFMAQGHIIPTINMAKLFASRGLKATIIIASPSMSKSIQTINNLGSKIDTRVLKFPSVEAGLPEGCDNLDFVVSQGDEEMLDKFLLATTMLQEQLENLLQEYRPDGLVADMFFPWATEAAANVGIPRMVFHGTSSFALCAAECIRMYEPYKEVSSDFEPFIIPNLPGTIQLTRMQLPDYYRHEQDDSMLIKLMKRLKESELESFGVIVNSFYELESDYVDFQRKVLGRKTWHIGPISLCNREIEQPFNEHECLKWLDTMKPDSVVYISFGSAPKFSSAQLKEIALALEVLGFPFIWVVKREKKAEGEEDKWLPRGFEARMDGKGLIIRGWAPQVSILEHEAIGGFVTHCGWNSTTEGISNGKPMVTWPISAEQFYNEKLVTQVLKTGIDVGVKEWGKIYADDIKSEAIEKAIRRLMEGEEGKEMRSKARKLRLMARQAVEKDGSSYTHFYDLVDKLKHRK